MQILIKNVASLHRYKLIYFYLFYLFINTKQTLSYLNVRIFNLFVFSVLVDCSRGSELRHLSAIVVPEVVFPKKSRLFFHVLLWSLTAKFKLLH
jgi:hypothetical protein